MGRNKYPEQTHSFDTVLSSQSNNPHFVMGALQNSITQDAPIISKLIEEGVKDGSIQTTEPALRAEILLLLLNFWTSPVLFKRNLEETKKHLSYLQSLMCLLGLDIIDNEFIENITDGYDKTGMF